MANEAAGLPVVGNPFSPDFFADEALTFNFINGTIRIDFAVVKPQEPAPPSPQQFVSIGRLVMPLDGARRLCLALYDYLKSQGLDPADLVSGGQAPQ